MLPHLRPAVLGLLRRTDELLSALAEHRAVLIGYASCKPAVITCWQTRTQFVKSTMPRRRQYYIAVRKKRHVNVSRQAQRAFISAEKT